MRHGGRRPKISKQELYDRALELCRKGGLVTMKDIVAFLPVSHTVFYRFFPTGSQELKEITEALEVSKRRACVSIRGRLYNMTQNPTAQLAVYKMLCTDEERAAISFSKTDLTTNGKDISNEPVIIEVIDSRDKVDKAITE